MPYKIIEHTADLRMEIEADTLQNLFMEAMRGMAAAMKSFALGRRAKWKDYVDLYFIMKDYYSFGEISKKGNEIFGDEFNERIFRGALAYFKDIDYTEKINYMKGFKASDKTIKKSLIGFSLS